MWHVPDDGRDPQGARQAVGREEGASTAGVSRVLGEDRRPVLVPDQGGSDRRAGLDRV